MPGRRTTNDLFELFPDLPRARHRATHMSRGHLDDQVEQMRLRVGENALRQKAAADRVRDAIARRRHF